jgi:hypothetical protein
MLNQAILVIGNFRVIEVPFLTELIFASVFLPVALLILSKQDHGISSTWKQSWNRDTERYF